MSEKKQTVILNESVADASVRKKIDKAIALKAKIRDLQDKIKVYEEGIDELKIDIEPYLKDNSCAVDNEKGVVSVYEKSASIKLEDLLKAAETKKIITKIQRLEIVECKSKMQENQDTTTVFQIKLKA